jgi:hypothetical protein
VLVANSKLGSLIGAISKHEVCASPDSSEFSSEEGLRQLIREAADQLCHDS